MSDRDFNTFDLLGPRTMRERIAACLRNPGSPWMMLLFILVLLGFFAATSVPSFLGAKMRAGVSRARGDLSELTAALDKYQSDRGAYPRTLSPLTTPTALLAALPSDPWSDTRSSPYRYHTNGTRFIIGSFGPDRDEATGGDFPWSDAEAMNALLEDEARLLPFSYDPSNGTVSEGDFWRVGGGSPTP